jgi:chemotaxis protein MotA
MIILIGALIVIASVFGGFMMAGGHVGNLIQISEFVIICGAALGALVIMSPKQVLADMAKQILGALKGSPYSRASYDELFKALYELFLLGRRNGMIALEEHVMNPESSAIFSKYPSFLHNERAIRLLCDGLRPIIDGKVKPDQLRLLLETEIATMEEEHYKPINVLTKVGDSMPGFGIVAAVLGIVITMSSISGPIEQIGHHVAAALVGTFLGILIAYGFVNPLATNLEFVGASQLAYYQCIATSVTGFAGGMAPVMAVEMARRGLGEELRPTAEELETMLKGVTAGENKPG